MAFIKTSKGYKRKERVMEELENNPITIREVEEEAKEAPNPEYAQALRDRKKFRKVIDKKVETDMKNATMKDFNLDKVERYNLDETLFEPVKGIHLKEDFDEEEELSFKDVLQPLVDKFGNNKYKYELVAQEYDRYSDGKIYKKTFYAPNDYIALYSMALHDAPTIDNFNLAFWDPYDIKMSSGNFPTYEEMLNEVSSEYWGDGDDYIISLKNLSTGKTLYEGDNSFEEYDDEDYDW